MILEADGGMLAGDVGIGERREHCSGIRFSGLPMTKGDDLVTRLTRWYRRHEAKGGLLSSIRAPEHSVLAKVEVEDAIERLY